MRKQLDDFVQALLRDQGRSENTLAAYRRDLRQYVGFLQDQTHCSSWDRVTDLDVMKYFYWLRDKGSASATMARKAAAVRGLHQYLLRHHESDRDPTYAIDIPKTERTRPKILTVEAVETLINTPDRHSPAGIRDHAMLEVLYATGMRVTELMQLDTGDLHLSMGFLHCQGKKGTERIIPIGHPAQIALHTYLDEARSSLLAEKDDSALFLNRNGRRMTRQGVWKILKKHAAQAGIGTQLSPETLRHTFAAHMLDNGADLESVEEMLGRAEPAVAGRYPRRQKRRLNDVYARCHPRA